MQRLGAGSLVLPMFLRLPLLLFPFAYPADGLKMHLGILGEQLNKVSSKQLNQARIKGSRKVGDGPGRPLYQINTVEMPDSKKPGKKCLTLRMDKFTHSFNIDSKEQDGNSIAFACYNDSLDATGWSTLEVQTTDDQDVPLGVRAYGAGILEGFITAPRITQFHNNVKDLLVKDTGGGVAMEAVDRVIRMALIAWEEFAGGDAGVEPEDDLPKQAWAALLQLRGMRDGNNLQAGQAVSENLRDGQEAEPVDRLSAYQIMVVNMHAEIPAMVELYGRSEQAKILEPNQVKADEQAAAVNKTAWPRWSAHAPKGSAIVKRLGPVTSPTDLIAGHVSFGDYGEMVRIMKTYKLNFGSAVSQVTMSSYPGCVSSTDDYFITGKGFVAMSTSLWLPSSGPDSMPAVTNEGLPSFLRALMATRIATQPRMWAKIYGLIKGIAGAKQWLIADYSKLKENQPIVNDTLWMVESLPRTQRAGDVSHILNSGGFFEAHGVPHFRDIRLIYGLPAEGPGSYQEARQVALIDKGGTISTIGNAREVLREVKPSRSNQLPISKRGDLDPTVPIPAGSIDAKVTNKCLMKKLALQAISGPPALADGSIFEWQPTGKHTLFAGWPKAGLPNKWNFTWVNVLPGTIQAPIVPSMSVCTPSSS